MKNEILNDYKPEVRSLLERCLKAGFAIDRTSNGDEWRKYAGDFEAAIDHLMECDNAFVRITKNGKACTLVLIFGNEPGVVLSDWHARSKDWSEINADVEVISTDHYQEWESKEQPKTTTKDKYPELWARWEKEGLTEDSTGVA